MSDLENLISEFVDAGPRTPLREILGAQRLYGADSNSRLAIALSCVVRASDIDARIYTLDSRDPGLSSFLGRPLRLIRRLFGQPRWQARHRASDFTGDRMRSRAALRLMRIALYRSPIASEANALRLARSLPVDTLQLTPYRHVYLVLTRFLHRREVGSKLDALVRVHYEKLHESLADNAATTYQIATEILAYREPATDFDAWRPQFEHDEVPANLRDLADLARAWGIGDDPVRVELVDASSTDEKQELIDAIVPRYAEIDAWLEEVDNSDHSDAPAAFQYLCQAAQLALLDSDFEEH